MNTARSGFTSTVLLLFLHISGVLAVPLLNGRFQTSTDVKNYLNLALDVAAMKESSSTTEKIAIYENVKFA
jgi:hypothetical protein